MSLSLTILPRYQLLLLEVQNMVTSSHLQDLPTIACHLVYRKATSSTSTPAARLDQIIIKIIIIIKAYNLNSTHHKTDEVPQRISGVGRPGVGVVVASVKFTASPCEVIALWQHK